MFGVWDWKDSYSEAGLGLSSGSAGAGSTGTAGAASRIAQVRAAHFAGEILIQFTAGTDANARDAILSQVGGRAEEVLRGNGNGRSGDGSLVRVTLGSGMPVEQAVAVLSKLPGVDFAEPNFIYTKQVVSNDPGYTLGYR